MANLSKTRRYACGEPVVENALRLFSPLALALGLVMALFAWPPVSAMAATPQESAEARQHFQKGQRHYELHEFSEALVEFKDAYRVIPDPVLLYNIGQCHWKLGQKREAVGFYRQYLRKRPDAPNHQEVQTRADELEAELAREGEQRSKPIPAAKPTPPAPQVAKPTAPPPAPMPLPRDPIVEAPADRPEPGLQVDAPVATTAEAGPVYTRWWFWTAAAVVVAAGVGVAVAASGRTEVGDCRDLGANCVRIGQ